MKSFVIAIVIILILAGAITLLFRALSPSENMTQEIPSKPANQLPNPPSAAVGNAVLQDQSHIVALETNFGEIKFQTYDADSPKTVKNFITLAQKGFYNNLTFHRVIKGFMIQGGDPLGNGTGGPGYTFEDELNPNTKSYEEGYKKGVVAMANAGPNTNGSQFFIMLGDNPLQHNYTIFGKVIQGQEVVDVIGNVPTGQNDKPLKAVIIKSVSIRPTAQ